MNEYEQQAKDFLERTGTEFKAVFVEHGKHFENDTAERDIYLITLKRGEREYSFKFGQSLECSGIRLFLKSGKRTHHRNFMLPEKILSRFREAQKKYYSQRTTATADIKKEFHDARRGFVWAFQDKYFSLSGIRVDLGEEPSPYDVLACLETQEYSSFEDFCSCLGYAEDSRSAEKIYDKVREQIIALQTLYNDEEMGILSEIC